MSEPERAAAPLEVTESDPNAGGPEGLAGGMGVSSERVGPMRGTAAGTHGAEAHQQEPLEHDTGPGPSEISPDHLPE